jgi:hypothetical protein
MACVTNIDVTGQKMGRKSNWLNNVTGCNASRMMAIAGETVVNQYLRTLALNHLEMCVSAILKVAGRA